MDNWINLLGLVAGGALLAVAVIALGFRIRPRLLRPDFGDGSQTLEGVSLPEGLPEPVRRFYARLGERIPAPRSLVACGFGRFRVRRMPLFGFLWAPLAWTLHLVPGEAFVWHSRLYWFRRMIVEGAEEFREGSGRYRMGQEMIQSDHLDESERVILGLFTLCLTPGAVLALNGVQWTALDEHSAGLSMPVGGRLMEFTLRFNPQDGSLASVETRRPASKDGQVYTFQFAAGDYRDQDGLNLPARLDVAWEDDFYARYEIRELRNNAPVADALREGVDR